ncbi:MAG: FadR family transcriptional regulator [Clostridiales bacterium]|nr:FadR family transcriptional regulator [Clostridiales bacterium]
MFELVTPITLGDRVLSQFVELINNGTFKLGEKLPGERDLYAQLGVSRPVLREVLSALRYMGYIESVQGDGTYICKRPLGPAMTQLSLQAMIEETQLFEIWEIRYLIEPEVVGLAAQRATDEDISLIREKFHLFEKNVQENIDHQAIIESTKAFHNAVAMAAHNEALAFLLESITNMMPETRERTIQVQGSSERAVAYHRSIMEEIAARNPEAAKKNMQKHLVDVKSDLEAYMASKKR